MEGDIMMIASPLPRNENSMQMTWDRLKSWLRPETAGWLLVAAGMILRLRQYLADRSLWHDEANLALNLVQRTFGGLTRPLDYDQGAPIGFLFIEKSLMIVLGNRDYILRLFPLFAGLVSVYLMYRIAREHFGAGSWFALLLFAISWPLIYYSSELKQYSSDVMFSLLLIYLALRCLGESARLKDYLLLGAAGFVSIWISHPSAFILAGIGLVLFLEKLIRKIDRQLLWTLGVGLVWAAGFGATYLVSLRYLISDPSLENYWRNGFMPWPPWENWSWYTRTYLSLLTTTAPGLDIRALTLAFSLLIVAGGLLLLLRDRRVALLVLLPFLFAGAASLLQRYPLRGRFLLFLVPLLILLMAEALGRFHALIAGWNRGLAGLISAALVAALLWVPAGSTYQNFLAPPLGDHIKPVMAYVEKHRTGDDWIYVYHGARPSFNYYAPFYGLEGQEVIAGPDLPDAPALRQFYKQVDQLRGNARVWVIFSHIVDCGGCDGDMETFYVQYLDRFGKVQEEFHAAGASVYLYNFASAQ